MGFILFYSKKDFILIWRHPKMRKELKTDEGLYAFLRKAAIRFEFFYPTTIISSKKYPKSLPRQRVEERVVEVGSESDEDAHEGVAGD